MQTTPTPSFLAVLLLTTLIASAAVPGMAQPLASVQPSRSTEATSITAEGVVEAVRQSTLAAQVPGAVIELRVKPGDRVVAGQVLVRLDPRATEQATRASEAQVEVARTARDIASRELNRQRALFQKGFISQAALDQAESAFRSAEAQWAASRAQATASGAQSDFHVIRAPYEGIVADVPIVQGDMALPGRPLLTVYDPRVMRVTATLSQSIAAPLLAKLPEASQARIDIAGQPRRPAKKLSIIPAADPATHTVQLRLDLAENNSDASLVPGVFARVTIAVPRTAETATSARSADTALSVPATAVLRRAEMLAVYVIDKDNRPKLRQVRIGRTFDGKVEVLSGLDANERVAVDAQAASRIK